MLIEEVYPQKCLLQLGQCLVLDDVSSGTRVIVHGRARRHYLVGLVASSNMIELKQRGGEFLVVEAVGNCLCLYVREASMFRTT